MSSKTGLSPEVRDGGGDRSGDGDVEVGGEGGDGVVRVASWLVMHHYPQHCVTCVLTVLTSYPPEQTHHNHWLPSDEKLISQFTIIKQVSRESEKIIRQDT